MRRPTFSIITFSILIGIFNRILLTLGILVTITTEDQSYDSKSIFLDPKILNR